MMGRNHLTIGLATTGITVATYKIIEITGDPAVVQDVIGLGVSILALWIGAIASLLPDLDSEHSLLQSRTVRLFEKKIPYHSEKFVRPIFGYNGAKIAMLPITTLSMSIGFVLSIVLKAIGKKIPHRHWTHSVVTGAVLALLFYFGLRQLEIRYWSWMDSLLLSITFFLGYTSHIFADSMTRSGTPYIYPFCWFVSGKRQNGHVLPRKWRIYTGKGIEMSQKTPFLSMFYIREQSTSSFRHWGYSILVGIVITIVLYFGVEIAWPEIWAWEASPILNGVLLGLIFLVGYISDLLVHRAKFVLSSLLYFVDTNEDKGKRTKKGGRKRSVQKRNKVVVYLREDVVALATAIIMMILYWIGVMVWIKVQYTGDLGSLFSLFTQ